MSLQYYTTTNATAISATTTSSSNITNTTAPMAPTLPSTPPTLPTNLVKLSGAHHARSVGPDERPHRRAGFFRDRVLLVQVRNRRLHRIHRVLRWLWSWCVEGFVLVVVVVVVVGKVARLSRCHHRKTLGTSDAPASAFKRIIHSFVRSFVRVTHGHCARTANASHTHTYANVRVQRKKQRNVACGIRFSLITSAIRLKVVHFPPVMVTILESLISITWFRERAWHERGVVKGSSIPLQTGLQSQLSADVAHACSPVVVETRDGEGEDGWWPA